MSRIYSRTPHKCTSTGSRNETSAVQHTQRDDTEVKNLVFKFPPLRVFELFRRYLTWCNAGFSDFPTMPHFILIFFFRRHQTTSSIDWHATMWLRERIFFSWCINEIDLIRAKASLATSSIRSLGLPLQSRRRHVFIWHLNVEFQYLAIHCMLLYAWTLRCTHVVTQAPPHALPLPLE